MGRDEGITEEQLVGLGNWEDSDAFSDEERAVLRYADCMTDTPSVIPDEVFEALHAHYDEAQIVEVTSAIAWENYRARFDHAFGVESEGFSKDAFCPLPVAAESHA